MRDSIEPAAAAAMARRHLLHVRQALGTAGSGPLAPLPGFAEEAFVCAIMRHRVAALLHPPLELEVGPQPDHDIGILDRLAQIAHALEGDRFGLRSRDLPTVGQEREDPRVGPDEKSRAGEADDGPDEELTGVAHLCSPRQKRGLGRKAEHEEQSSPEETPRWTPQGEPSL